MPRLLSSYAANKRVEDGLKKKQEQIRKDYMRTTHRYLDETDKLIEELIQIHVRTPSAFQPTPAGSARAQHRPPPSLSSNQNLQHPHHRTSNNSPTPHQGRDPTQPSLPPQPNIVLRNRCRGGYMYDGTATTDDGTMPLTRKDIPPPKVEVRGKEVFYQYDCRPNQWKKLEPTYKTKVLLHRNNNVSQALKSYTAQWKQAENTENARHENGQIEQNQARKYSQAFSGRKSSVFSRSGVETGRRDSEFMRRGSRRGSRFYHAAYDDDFEDDNEIIPPIVALKPQLSPGHTPRMLDGWTIMNWCLWSKQQSKPVWASKRYMARKNREYKRFQASRSTAGGQQLPAKPNSANAATREARRKESMTAQEKEAKVIRAKSVPAKRNNTTIDEVDEEDDINNFPPAVEESEMGFLRPVTSIVRSSAERDTVLEDNRPKTTNPTGRYVLDATAFRIGLNGRDEFSSARDDNDDSIADDSSNPYSFREATDDVLFLRPKTIRKDKTLSIDNNPQTLSQPTDLHESRNSNFENSVIAVGGRGDKPGLNERIPNLAATQVTVHGLQEVPTTKSRSFPVPALSLASSKNPNTEYEAKPMFPQVMALIPQLGTDSPR